MTDFETLRREVLVANLRLRSEGLASLTWGNVSARSGDGHIIAIKPSGVSYESMTVEDIVVLTVDGEVLDGTLRPSSDTPTHLELYRRFAGIGAITHVHSPHATAFAQARRSIPALGTTHADHFSGSVSVTRSLTATEVDSEYELNTGHVIAEHLLERSARVEAIPAVLVAGHGPFTWGPTAKTAVDNAVALEQCARFAILTAAIAPDSPELEPWVLAKHHERKHGPDAYYGQESS